MPSKEYFDIPAMNQSKLKNILWGVEEYRKYETAVREPSEEQELGTAVHLLVFEPEKKNSIICVPKYDGNTRKGIIFNHLKQGRRASYFPVSMKKKKNQEDGKFYEVSPDEDAFIGLTLFNYEKFFDNPSDYIILDQEDYERAYKMAEAVLANEDCKILLKACEEFETVKRFSHKSIDFKAQLDGRGILNGIRFILDLKTSSMKPMPVYDEELYAYLMKKEIEKWYYHFQAACYLKSEVGDFMSDIMNYFVIYVRSSYPHQVYPVMLGDDTRSKGEALFEKACDLYRRMGEGVMPTNSRLRVV